MEFPQVGRVEETESSSLTQGLPYLKKAVGCALLMFLVGLGSYAPAQDALPFAVSNPKHKKWSAEEAGRIYYSACDLLARTIRPEKPPRLHPKFLLVMGADDNELVRTDTAVEIHLKAWDPDKFAEGVVVAATRELLQGDDLTKIARQSVSSAQATVSVVDLRKNQ
jgi:hypothetical protein